jgi:hypothetical protein
VSWFRIDDKSAFHRKILKAGNEAWGALCRAGAQSAGEGTDGLLEHASLLAIAPMKVWQRAIDAGLLDRVGPKEFQIHDFLQWNESASEIEAKAVARRKKSTDAAQARWGARGRVLGLDKPRPTDARTMPGASSDDASSNATSTAQAHTPRCPIPDHTDPDPDPTPAQASPSGLVEDIAAELRRHPKLAAVAAGSFATEVAGLATSSATSSELTCRAIGAAAFDLPESPTEAAVRSKIRGYVSNAKRVEAQRRGRGQPEVQRTPGYQATEERRRAEHHAAVRADPTAQMFDMFGTDDLPTEERP